MGDTGDPAFSGLPCAWARLDAAGVVLAVNSALCRLAGASAAELQGRPFDVLLTNPARVLHQSYLKPLLHLHGSVEEFALTLAARGGAAVDVLVYASRSARAVEGEGEGEGEIEMVFAPIRQRRRMEDELLRIKRAADHAPGVIFQLMQMPDGRRFFPYASEALRRLYGVTPDDARVSADAVLGLIDAGDRAAMAEPMRLAAQAGAEWRGQYRVRLPDGRACWHEAEASPRSLANGVVLWHGHVADVTQRREMEAAVADRQAMERVHRARSEFLARVSHELRTPLNGILGFAQLLACDQADNLRGLQRDRLEVVRASGRHLLELINDVLDVTRIESGQVSVARQTLALGALLGQALRTVEPQALAAGVRLLPLSAPPGLSVIADEQRLLQVLAHLLSNAVKYNRAGGTVALAARAEDRSVRVSVTDTGTGLSEAQQAELFQPFNRLGAEGSGAEGTGLGLVISKHLLALMGGSIAVESLPGRGSTFSIELPAAQQARAAAAGPALVPEAVPHTVPDLVLPEGVDAGQAAPAASGRVLYAEDNEVNTILMQAIFGMRPQVVLVTVADAAAALSEARRQPFDLLLLDVHLPDMSGIELLAAMRAHGLLRDVPAIAVSAAARSEDIARAQAAGFADYWTKPLDVDQTLAALDRLLAPTSP